MTRLRLPSKRSPQLAWVITGPLAAAAVIITLVAQVGRPIPPHQWLLALGFFGLFVVAVSTVIHFEIRRQSFSLSVSEVPLLLALFYLSPMLVVVSWVTAATLVNFRRKQSPVKLWFNVATAGASASCVAILLRLGSSCSLRA